MIGLEDITIKNLVKNCNEKELWHFIEESEKRRKKLIKLRARVALALDNIEHLMRIENECLDKLWKAKSMIIESRKEES